MEVLQDMKVTEGGDFLLVLIVIELPEPSVVNVVYMYFVIIKTISCVMLPFKRQHFIIAFE